MKILVTGGSGFIGTNLIKKLLEEGHNVVNYSLEDNPWIPVRTIKGDITKEDFSFIKDENPEVVIHLAALSNQQMTTDRDYAIQVNVEPMYKLLRVCLELNLKKFVFMSTSVVYDDESNTFPVKETGNINPERNNYIYTKVEGEKICQQFLAEGLPVIIFRLSNIYGPYQGWKKYPTLIPQIFSQAILEKHIHTLNRTSVRDFIFIDDATTAIMAGAESDFTGTINLSSGKGTSVGEIVDAVAALTKVDTSTDNGPGSGPNIVICDNTLLKEKIGYTPKISLEEGLKKTYHFFKDVIEPN